MQLRRLPALNATVLVGKSAMLTPDQIGCAGSAIGVATHATIQTKFAPSSATVAGRLEAQRSLLAWNATARDEGQGQKPGIQFRSLC
mmetsp:Transcript_16793/g.24911  ORF Transcript_16793/g.24911 Transcript_16793/m.24911 type:complete len:87 (-) Transcript_16793:78-338(-)